jgi:hypothetical protein
MSLDRERGRSFELGYRTAKTQMEGELHKLRNKIAGNHEALFAQIAELAEELAQAKAELARLRALTIASGLEPSARVH